MTISDDECTFFAGLGERVAQLREGALHHPGATGRSLGVSQQTLQAYEVGRWLIPVSTLRLLAKTLDVWLDELMAEGDTRRANAGRCRRFSGSWGASARFPSPSGGQSWM